MAHQGSKRRFFIRNNSFFHVLSNAMQTISIATYLQSLAPSQTAPYQHQETDRLKHDSYCQQDRGNDQPGDRYNCKCTTSNQVTLAMHNALRNGWVYLPQTGTAPQCFNQRFMYLIHVRSYKIITTTHAQVAEIYHLSELAHFVHLALSLSKSYRKSIQNLLTM